MVPQFIERPANLCNKEFKIFICAWSCRTPYSIISNCNLTFITINKDIQVHEIITFKNQFLFLQQSP